MQKAGGWLKSIQKPDGSFGETANSYIDPSLKSEGLSTPSQTAWGAMGMLSVFGPDDPHVVAAVSWLQSMQLDEVSAGDPVRNPDGDPAGSWVEREMTGTGFPRVFYLRYHMYRLYFPMMALGRYVTARQNSDLPSECGASAMA